MYSVAIVSPEKSLEPIEKVIRDESFECKFYPYIYNHLSDIDAIYADCRGSVMSSSSPESWGIIIS